MYSRNLVALVSPMIKDGDYVVNLEDDVIGPCCVTHDGEVRVGKPAMAATT
jgi:NAD/NADP transhydrogenase alpha subunit